MYRKYIESELRVVVKNPLPQSECGFRACSKILQPKTPARSGGFFMLFSYFCARSLTRYAEFYNPDRLSSIGFSFILFKISSFNLSASCFASPGIMILFPLNPTVPGYIPKKRCPSPKSPPSPRVASEITRLASVNN